MKNRILNTVLILLTLGFLAVSVSSCNRGYGCPNEFSLKAAAAIPMVILQQ